MHGKYRNANRGSQAYLDKKRQPKPKLCGVVERWQHKTFLGRAAVSCHPTDVDWRRPERSVITATVGGAKIQALWSDGSTKHFSVGQQSVAIPPMSIGVGQNVA